MIVKFRTIIIVCLLMVAFNISITNADIENLPIDEFNNVISLQENDVLVNTSKDLFSMANDGSGDILQKKVILMRELSRRVGNNDLTIQIINDLADNALDNQYRLTMASILQKNINILNSEDKLRILRISGNIYRDKNESDSTRVFFIKVNSDFLWVCHQVSLISDSEYNQYSEDYLDALFSDEENIIVRRAGMKALRGINYKNASDRLANYINNDSNIPKSVVKIIMTTLGEWRELDVIPSAIRILNNSDDLELIDAAAYTLGYFESTEIIAPLVNCIEDEKDNHFACRDAINKNLDLIVDLLKNENSQYFNDALNASFYIRGNPDELTNVLYQLLYSNDRNVRLKAFRRLIRDNDKNISFRALDILENEKDTELNREIISQRSRLELEELEIVDNRAILTTDYPVEVGDPVYREIGFLWGWVFDYNHTAIYAGLYPANPTGCSDCIIEANKDSNDVVYTDFSTMYDYGSAYDYFGPYKLNNSYLDFNDRQSIRDTVSNLNIAPIGYPSFIQGITFPICLDYNPSTVDNIEISEIDALRCDGVVEYAYEVNGFDVWDQETTPGDHFDISNSTAWADEHNNGPDWTPECDEEASPLAQRDACSSSSHTYLTEQAIASNPTMTYSHQPSTNQVFLYATDELSGIYSIEWKIGDGDWQISPLQDNYPEANNQFQTVTMTHSDWVYVNVTDNAGNIAVGDPFFVDFNDPGERDEIVIGNLDGSDIGVYPGQLVEIPVWAKTDDNVGFIHIPLATDNQHVTVRQGGSLMSPLSEWDDVIFIQPDLNQPQTGYTSQSLLGFWDIFGDPNPVLNTNGVYIEIARFLIQISSDVGNIGQISTMLEGFNPDNLDALLGLDDGVTEFRPDLIISNLEIMPAPTYYVPNCEFDNSLVCCPGKDIVYKIVIKDDTNNPVVGYNDIWIDFSFQSVSYHCPSVSSWPRIYPISPSNSNGELFYYVPAGGIGIGDVSIRSPYEEITTIEFVSSLDTDGNTDVEAADWIGQAPENDYNGDGQISWEDIELFTPHVGHYCNIPLQLSMTLGIITDPPSGHFYTGDTVSVSVHVTNNNITGCVVNTLKLKYRGFNIGGSTWIPFDSLLGSWPLELGQTEILQGEFIVPPGGHGCIRSYIYIDTYSTVFTKQKNLNSLGGGYNGGGDPPLSGLCEVEIGGVGGFPVNIEFFPALPGDWTYMYSADEFFSEGLLTLTVEPGEDCDFKQPGVSGSVTAVGYGSSGDYLGSLTCEYTIPITGLYPGDANNSCTVNGLDVIFLVNYFKGIGIEPQIYYEADANGNCSVNGLDVTYLVAYFKGTGPAPLFGENCNF